MMTKEQLQSIHNFLALVFVTGTAQEVSKVLTEIGALQQAIMEAIAQIDSLPPDKD